MLSGNKSGSSNPRSRTTSAGSRTSIARWPSHANRNPDNLLERTRVLLRDFETTTKTRRHRGPTAVTNRDCSSDVPLPEGEGPRRWRCGLSFHFFVRLEPKPGKAEEFRQAVLRNL